MNKGSGNSPTFRNLEGKRYVLYKEYKLESKEELNKDRAKLKAQGMLVKRVDCGLYVRNKIEYTTPFIPDLPSFAKAKKLLQPVAVPIHVPEVIYKEPVSIPVPVIPQQKLIHEPAYAG